MSLEFPSIDDWVCASHNVGLLVHKGQAKCPKEGCFGWMSVAEVHTLRQTFCHYAINNAGFLLRNKVYRETPEEAEWINGLGWQPSEDYRLWWHLFGGNLPIRYVIETEEDMAHYLAMHGDPNMEVWVTALVAGVPQDADSLFPETDRLIKNGIRIDDDGHTLVLHLLDSWHHEPTEQEVSIAVHQALLKNIVRSFHGGDAGGGHRDVDG